MTNNLKSLFITALPRSFTTAVYRYSVKALGLKAPSWTTDGEILNARHLVLASNELTNEPRFTTFAKESETFQRLKSFACEAVVQNGYAYKDVVQPFVATEAIKTLDVAVLRIRRPLADIAYAMAERGWFYPQSAAEKFDKERAFIEGLLRGANAIHNLENDLPQIETLDYDDIIFDNKTIDAALKRLYPDAVLNGISYLDGGFQRNREVILERRKSDKYKQTVALINEVADEIKIQPPTGWATKLSKKKPAKTVVTKKTNSKKPTILVVGDAVAPTGFARVTQSIISRLKVDYDFHQLGINYNGDPHNETWKIYPAGLGGEPHGVRRLAELVTKIKPDAILLVNDIWIIADYLKVLAPLPHKVPVAAYIPIDSEPINANLIRQLAPLDRIIVYTDFAEQTLKSAADSAKAVDSNFNSPPIQVIPHGVDTKLFYPLFSLEEDLTKGRREVRKMLLPNDKSFEDSFIVLNANRNQPRKRIDISIEGFAMFAQDKPANVKLYLHMGTTDQGWNINELAIRYNIAERLIMSHGEPGPPNLTAEQLNKMYNACDIGLNTAEGEGWGLPAFEHAATGAAQIVPAYSGPGSVWNGAAEMLVPTMKVVSPMMLTNANLIAPETVRQSLQSLYENPQLLNERSIAAFRRATEPRYTWDKVADSFGVLLNDLLEVSGNNGER
jgi:glycosyltransferase involved in cell wall biosynthesis